MAHEFSIYTHRRLVLGKPFASVSGDPGAALRLKRLETVAKVAALAAEHVVDAVLVAGDVFDDNEVSDETLRRTMNALGVFEGQWILPPKPRCRNRAVRTAALTQPRDRAGQCGDC